MVCLVLNNGDRNPVDLLEHIAYCRKESHGNFVDHKTILNLVPLDEEKPYDDDKKIAAVTDPLDLSKLFLGVANWTEVE